eukprot:TRINITY_DN4967_c0_g1_i2.p1 TRINITY_DN4967_c0_g1~~TRINITY_DN4967_c0_g1_i2.p1  ORF type:complete len:189 (+),score=24.91 TRINITY_DN4967_c0_g1_i2:524-1090(+)
MRSDKMVCGGQGTAGCGLGSSEQALRDCTGASGRAEGGRSVQQGADGVHLYSWKRARPKDEGVVTDLTTTIALQTMDYLRMGSWCCRYEGKLGFKCVSAHRNWHGQFRKCWKAISPIESILGQLQRLQHILEIVDGQQSQSKQEDASVVGPSCSQDHEIDGADSEHHLEKKALDCLEEPESKRMCRTS